MSPYTDSARLLQFNQRLLEQALVLVGVWDQTRLANAAQTTGAHLRHVIEHYEALVFPARAAQVDYDSRPRERELEVNPALARARLLALHATLGSWDETRLDTPLRVPGLGGEAGEFRFSVLSSIGRELAFVASHTVHHFALLLTHCQQLHISLPADFGKAPATVAHETALRADAAHLHQEIPCPYVPLTT